MKERELNGKKLGKKKYCRKQMAKTNVIKRLVIGVSLEAINISLIG
jgi:hypothetical protein